jgi:uncharacterized protein YbjT (DUF2867 family)
MLDDYILFGMRVAVVGGTGQVGRHVVDALARTGHEPVTIARSVGIDVISGEGLDAALAGVASVVDVTNTPAQEPDATRAFFGTITKRHLDAEQRAGVAHHLVLSIVCVDRVRSNAHYEGKRLQEKLVRSGPIPFTILRATQFHEFAGMVASWTRRDDVAVVPPLLVQPVAASEVGDILAELAVGPPSGDIVELGGPQTEDLAEMARRTFAAEGEHVRVDATWTDGPLSDEMAGDVLLPGPNARLGTITFDDWLTHSSA